MTAAPATTVFETIHRVLAAEPKTREPMNALVIWTELGKGLAGTLERIGAEKGLLRQVIATYCREKGAADGVDLSRWAYRLEGKARLGKIETAQALQRVQAELEAALPELAADAETGGDARRQMFMAVVRGWFPVGLDIVRALPGAKTADDATRLGALRTWCERYLPEDAAGPADLGVRVTRGE